ncbi:MAG TPA: cytochrome c oxidase subunit II [Solirubrobacterales bacterium]|nr:cytochrome c oxidase subunit II [Solirubrobacterales bacterium]
MTRLPYLKLALATLASGAIISVVLLQFNWFGDEASTAAPDIDRLLDIMIVLSSFIFAGVCVALGYALIKWRVKPGDESDGLPIHGNTKLEIIWTLIPTIIVLFAGGYSWIVLNDIEKEDPDRLTVNVYSQQFAWTFGYPENGNKWSEGELHVPVNRQIDFQLHAQDVIHSFWVPEWRIKKDNVPGITTDAIVTPDKIGTYQLICTELCGIGHTTMRAKVVVESEEDYAKWVKGLDSEVPEQLVMTADQALELEKQIQEKSDGIDSSGVDETEKDNVDQS